MQITAVFAYGTLLFPELVEALLGWRPASAPARILGFERYRLAGAPFPAAIPIPGGTLCGLLYRGMDASDLLRLDRFESHLYQRIPVQAVTSGGRLEPAWIWQLHPSRRQHLLRWPWSPARFRACQLDRYVTAQRLTRRPAPQVVWV